jgi:hypothetical protein
MTNSWINHAKLFAAKHRLKYADALKHPACKMSYYSSDGKNKRILLKGGDKTRKFTCTSCGQRRSTDERFLSPRRCLNENGNPLQSPYRICKQCWWLFADENAHNPCPGCVSNLPFRRTRSPDIYKVKQVFKPKTNKLSQFEYTIETLNGEKILKSESNSAQRFTINDLLKVNENQKSILSQKNADTLNRLRNPEDIQIEVKNFKPKEIDEIPKVKKVVVSKEKSFSE